MTATLLDRKIDFFQSLGIQKTMDSETVKKLTHIVQTFETLKVQTPELDYYFKKEIERFTKTIDTIKLCDQEIKKGKREFGFKYDGSYRFFRPDMFIKFLVEKGYKYETDQFDFCCEIRIIE